MDRLDGKRDERIAFGVSNFKAGGQNLRMNSSLTPTRIPRMSDCYGSFWSHSPPNVFVPKPYSVGRDTRRNYFTYPEVSRQKVAVCLCLPPRYHPTSPPWGRSRAPEEPPSDRINQKIRRSPRKQRGSDYTGHTRRGMRSVLHS